MPHTDTNTTAHLHEHAGRIALNFDVAEGTIYITPALAATLAEELTLASSQITKGDHCPTRNIEG